MYLGMATKPSIWGKQKRQKKTWLECRCSIPCHTTLLFPPIPATSSRQDWTTCVLHQRKSPQPPLLHAGDIVFPIQRIDVLNFVLQIRSNLGGLKEGTKKGSAHRFRSYFVEFPCEVCRPVPPVTFHLMLLVWPKVADSLTSAFVGRTELFE